MKIFELAQWQSTPVTPAAWLCSFETLRIAASVSALTASAARLA